MPLLRFLAALLLSLIVALPASAQPSLLVDGVTGEVLYAEEAGVSWHPASLTKMMTAYVAFAALAAGRVTLDTPVIISRNAWNQAPAKSGLEIGEGLRFEDALYVMLVKSANDVAIAIAETVSGSVDAYVAEMNGMAGRMGLTATHFDNPNGLHSPGQVTSARDLAMLALYLRRDFPQFLPMFGTEAVNLDGRILESNNALLEHFAGTTGMKTGYVCNSGLNIVATVDRGGRSLIAVVLGGATARERNEMAAELLLRGLSGAYIGEGVQVMDVRNAGGDPVDMRSQICGKKSKAYLASRAKLYPMGLKGQPSYLTDRIKGVVHVATSLKKGAGIALPRRRPTIFDPVATSD